MNKASQVPAENSSHAVAKSERIRLKKITEASEATAERLMPYGAAAKAIFVKANGLVAYNQAFRREHSYCPEQSEKTLA